MVSSNSRRPRRSIVVVPAVLLALSWGSYNYAEAWSHYARALVAPNSSLDPRLPNCPFRTSSKNLCINNKRLSLSSTSAADNEKTSQPSNANQSAGNTSGNKRKPKTSAGGSNTRKPSKRKGQAQNHTRQSQRSNSHKNHNSRQNSPKSTHTPATTVSELVQNVRTVLHTKVPSPRANQPPRWDWRTAWSILRAEATTPASAAPAPTSPEDHTTILPVRVYYEILESVKKEKHSWQDAIRLVQYMEGGSDDADDETNETLVATTDDDAAVDKYNSRPWYIPEPNYEIYHTLIECCANYRGGRKDAHDASVYWLSKVLRKLEADLRDQTASRLEPDAAEGSSTLTNRDRKLVRNSIQLVLGSLSRQRKWRDALQLLEYAEILSRPDNANIPLTVVQYNTVLTCLARSRQVGQCQRLLQRLQKRSRELSRTRPYVAPPLSETDGDETEEAEAVPNRLHPDEISYNAVIGACASAGRWKEALRILDECYREPGVTPNIYIYTNAMRACAKGGNTQRALSLLQVVKDKGLPVDSYCYTAVIDACAKGKQWKKALELFDEMEARGIEPSQVTYSATISALGNGLQWERALWLLNVMREKGMAVNLITYNAAITALAKSSKNRHSAKLSSSPSGDNDPANEEELWSKALDLLKQMDQDGIEPDGFCYSSAINCCGAEGRWKEACELIEKMKDGGPKSQPNKVAYTAAIMACGRAGQGSKALELFQNMRDDGLAADRVAYNALFSALRVSKDADRAYELWGEICGRRQNASIATARDIASPDIITLTDCIATLSRAGYTAQMDEVFREAVERGIVLGSCNDLDEQWEIDLSGLPFPIARAAIRYQLHSIVSHKHRYNKTNEDDSESDHLQDMVFITGIGKAQQKRREESSLASGTPLATVKSVNNVLDRKDRTTSLRDFVRGILETDFEPSLNSVVPERAQGTVVIEENVLYEWLNKESGKVLETKTTN